VLARAGQSVRVYAGKIRHGWPLIMRSLIPLLRRFVLARIHPRY